MENGSQLVYTRLMDLTGKEQAVLEDEGLKIIESVSEEQTEEGRKKKRKSRILTVLVFIAANAAVISYTAVHEFGSKPAGKLELHFGFFNYAMLVCGLACVAGALLAETLKYVFMMRSLKVPVRKKTAFETAALGKYYDNITPSGIGGQPFQVYNLYKNGYSSGTSLAMALTAFLTMQTGFILLAILVFVLFGDTVTIVPIRITAYIGAVCYSIVPIMIVLFTVAKNTALKILRFAVHLGAKLHILKDEEGKYQTFSKTLEEYRDGILLMSRKRGRFILLFALSFAFQVFISSIPYFVLLAFNGQASYFEVLAMTIFVYCSITIIPTPGNSGAAEGSFYLIFSRLDPTGLFWSMLVWRGICYYSFIVIGLLIYAGRAAGSVRKKGKHTHES